MRQLRDLAAAFDIKINMEAPKKDILPVLIEAEGRGVFRQVHLADRARLLRANYNSDEGKLGFPEAEITALETREEPVQHVLKSNISAVNKEGVSPVVEWHGIIKRVKAVMGQDFKTHGKRKPELLALLAEHDPGGPFSGDI